MSEYKEIIVIDYSNPSGQIHFKSKSVIRNILNVLDSAFGNKLDSKQRFMIRKVVLDEINSLESLSQALIKAILDDENEFQDKNKT